MPISRVRPESPGIRPDWHFGTVRQCQLFAGGAAGGDEARFTEYAAELVRRLPRPQGPAESAMQRLMLLELALRSGAVLHDRLHRPHERRKAPCPFGPAEMTAPYWIPADAGSSPASVFLDWAAAYFEGLCRCHPSFVAIVAAARLRRHYDRRLNVRSLARDVGSRPDRLRRHFHVTFGMSMREYHARVKARHALQLIAGGGGKIDTIARECGFGSRKSFYAGVRTFASLKPSDVRRLPPERLKTLMESLVPAARA